MCGELFIAEGRGKHCGSVKTKTGCAWKNHKDRVNKLNSKRRQYLKRAVWEYLGGECIECGTREDLNIHHIIPRSMGGTDSLGNFELLCSKCHRMAHKALHLIS